MQNRMPKPMVGQPRKRRPEFLLEPEEFYAWIVPRSSPPDSSTPPAAAALVVPKFREPVTAECGLAIADPGRDALAIPPGVYGPTERCSYA
ncbi:MAG TPA: hypothetical protein VLX58_15930 [Bryobacteraceae bacterium]|nr:hypothetical protein [Bryobacteraceae bacterium]